MKYNFLVKEIDKQQALDMIQKYHYSNTLPKLNKHFIGFYLDNDLVGCITLGWGVQPKNTIQKIFPSLTSNDYYEIGRMCMTEEMPKNSESQMIKHLCKWLKEHCKNIKVLFTWADGMLGKVGYVYQSCSFNYIGYCLTDIYMIDGKKIHPRQTRALLSPNDKRKTVRPTKEQMQQYNIEHYKGKQYKYFKFLCSHKEEKRLLDEMIPTLLDYPKENDLYWEKQTINGWVKCNKPIYKTDLNYNQVKEEMKSPYDKNGIFDELSLPIKQ